MSVIYWVKDCTGKKSSPSYNYVLYFLSVSLYAFFLHNISSFYLLFFPLALFISIFIPAFFLIFQLSDKYKNKIAHKYNHFSVLMST